MSEKKWEVEFGGSVIVGGEDEDEAESNARFMIDKGGVANIHRVRKISGFDENEEDS
jgi:hypothetical protein